MSYHYVFKSIVVGNSGVGKSSILLQYIQDRFNKVHDITIGVEFGAKIINIRNKNIKIQIWDTAGQERFRSITRSYYRDTAAILLVYDITNRNSFTDLEIWINEINGMNKNAKILLIGNKSDLESNRQVSYNEGIEFARKLNINFIEISAKNKKDTDMAFNLLMESILDNVENGTIVPNLNGSGVKSGTVKNYNQGEISFDTKFDDKPCCIII
jgi:Ras-related protein Rab-2A